MSALDKPPALCYNRNDLRGITMAVKEKDSVVVYTYESGSPFPGEDLGYNWLNYSYPLAHKHQHWEIVLVTHGQLLHRINGKESVMSRGDMCLVRPDDCHSLHFSHGLHGTHLSFLIKKQCMQRIFSTYKETLYDELVAQKNPYCVSLSDIETQSVINQILNLQTIKLSVPEKIFRLKSIVNKLLNVIINDNLFHQKLPDWLTEFLFVLSDPHLQTNDVKSLARYTPYSYSRLAPVFKQLTGRTIIEYVTQIKIKYAADLLKTTDTPITQIALDLHYESLSHFIRTFKKVYNVTPSRYRKHLSS